MIEFDWLIHYKCNYRCPYCFFDGMWEEVSERNKYFSAEKWISAWKKLFHRYGNIKLIITGGEPFEYPEFLIMLCGLTEFAEISFDTNFSCSLDDLKSLAENADTTKLFMGLSFHPLFADIEKFINNANYLKRNKINFRVHYVTYPPQLNRIDEYRKIFFREGFRFTPIPFRGFYNNKEYPAAFGKEEQNIIYEVTSKIEKIDAVWAENQVVQVKSKGKMCRAGQHYARVDSDGMVYPCGNDYTKSDIKYKLGNIFDENFKMKDEPMLCRQDTCPCEFRWLVSENE